MKEYEGYVLKPSDSIGFDVVAVPRPRRVRSLLRS